MVSSARTASRLRIIARPNLSADWRTNQLVWLALAVPLLLFSGTLALMGAWLVLPFAGIELLALGIALRYTQRKLHYQQVITLSDDSVCVDMGHRAPGEHWRFSRHSAGLTITTERHPWDAPGLCLHDRQNRVALGEFLNREDSLKLLALLQGELQVRGRGASVTRGF